MKKKSRKENKLATIKTVKKLIRVDKEVKYLQGGTGNSTGAIPYYMHSTGIVEQLNSLPQGDDVGQRTGDQARAVSLDMKIFVVCGRTTFSQCRIIVFWARMETSTGPTVADVLAETANYLAPTSQYNMRTQGKIQIIYDKRFVIGANNDGTGTGTLLSTTNAFDDFFSGVDANQRTGVSFGNYPSKILHIKKNLKNKLMQWQDNQSSSLMTKGWLGWCWLSDQQIGDSDLQKPKIVYNYTLRYTDS